MAAKEKMPLDIKWATRQRLEYIEIMAYYTGVITRSDIASAFGLSDAAATKDLKLYGQLAPDNLHYKHSVFGFVPHEQFSPLFADLSPAVVLPMMAQNLTSLGGPHANEPLYGVTMAELPLPHRLPDKAVLAQITRAIRHHQKLEIHYHSMTERDSQQQRTIEPHALVNTGLRWHVRAYSDETYDFRDFVLSRFTQARCLDVLAESSAQYDDDWSEVISLQLSPHPKLAPAQQASLALDYGAQNQHIEIKVRRALIAYVLQRLMVDTSADHHLNPKLYQLALMNRQDIEPFAAWALHQD